MANIQVNFLSYTLHRAVDLTVIIPTMCFPEMMQENPHHTADAKYPVLYLLHGYGNNHLSATHISHSMISEVLYLYIQGIGSPAAICAILTMTCFRTVIDITFLVNTILLDIIFDGYPFNCNFLLASVI